MQKPQKLQAVGVRRIISGLVQFPTICLSSFLISMMAGLIATLTLGLGTPLMICGFIP